MPPSLKILKMTLNYLKEKKKIKMPLSWVYILYLKLNILKFMRYDTKLKVKVY